MHEILLPVEGQISSNSAGNSLRDGVGAACDLTERSDGTRAFEDGRDNRPRGDEFEQVGKERLSLVLGIVGAGQVEGNGLQLECNDAESLLLDAAENLPHESAGYSVWLYKYKGALSHDH